MPPPAPLVGRGKYLAHAKLISTQQPAIRKSVVFCFVDMYFKVSEPVYEQYISALNVNQRKLIHVYIERKQDKN